MPDDEQRLKNRFEELAERAASRRCRTYSDFLTMAEQDTLSRMYLSVPFELFGGHEAAERRLCRFSGGDDMQGSGDLPICCLRIEPKSQKFSEALTHRDFLGALMGLGLRREVLGDIAVIENRGYLFCLDSVAGYIAEQLTQVGRTAVKVTRADLLPDNLEKRPEKSQVVVSSERLDAIIAAVYKLSRSESQELFSQGRVFVNSRPAISPSNITKDGSIVSVRGFGRFIYGGAELTTRRGRLRVNVEKY